jgi:hypothetical protein
MSVGFRTGSPEVGGISTLVRERLVALSRALPSASESSPRVPQHDSLPSGRASQPIHRRGSRLGGTAHHPGLPRTADMRGIRSDSHYRHAVGVGGTRVRIVVTVATKRWGPIPAGSGGSSHRAYAIHARRERRDSLADSS